jgi:hypothetical protein
MLATWIITSTRMCLTSVDYPSFVVMGSGRRRPTDVQPRGIALRSVPRNGQAYLTYPLGLPLFIGVDTLGIVMTVTRAASCITPPFKEIRPRR